MEALWTPLFSFAVFTLIFGIGDFFSSKTKGIVSSILFGSLVFLVGYCSNIIPKDAIANTGMISLMASFGLALMVVGVGTTINLRDLCAEWRTVIIALAGMIGIAAIALTLSGWIIGREYALVASGPISGGLLATVLVSNACTEAGRTDLATFAALVEAFQVFAGIPLASYALKRESGRLLSSGTAVTSTEKASVEGRGIRLIKQHPAWAESPMMILCRVALVGVLAYWCAQLTRFGGPSPKVSVFIFYLIFGVLFTELGFLDKNALTKSSSFGFLLVALIALLPSNFAGITWEMLGGLVLPLILSLVFGAIGIILFSVLAGRLLHYSAFMSAAIGLCCMFGYPITQIITDEVVSNLKCSEEERQAIHDNLMPKMIVSGFVSVTLASVAFTSIIVPMIF